MKRFVTTFLISILVFSLVFFKVGSVILSDNGKSVAEKETELDDENKENLEKEPLDENDKNLSFVLLGIDDGGLKSKTGVRSDTIMLVDVNFETGGVNLLTIPRDTRVDVNGKMDKINHAHARGGADLTLETINKFLLTDFENYVKVDFKSVMNIVDIVGGVNMNVPVDMNYDDPTAKPELHIHLKKGPQLLDGKKSHDVLRFRHNNGQDFYPGGHSREEVQQLWLKEFAKTVLSPKNILRLPKIVEASFKSVDTNIPFTKILEYSFKANKIDVEKIRMETIPIEDGRKVDGVFYFLADKEDCRRLADELFK